MPIRSIEMPAHDKRRTAPARILGAAADSLAVNMTLGMAIGACVTANMFMRSLAGALVCGFLAGIMVMLSVMRDKEAKEKGEE